MIETYERSAPEWCRGCGQAVQTGDLVMRYEERWLLCRTCGEGHLIDAEPLAAWVQGARPTRRAS